jgi:hypothetical protein
MRVKLWFISWGVCKFSLERKLYNSIQYLNPIGREGRVIGCIIDKVDIMGIYEDFMFLEKYKNLTELLYEGQTLVYLLKRA